MSSFVYGQITREEEKALRDPSRSAPDNKLVTAIAALVPTEVIAFHGLIVSVTTKTDDKGVTTITNSVPLQWSLPLLAVIAVVMFVVGRLVGSNSPPWGSRDWIRAVVPALAFVAWTGLIGTSALSPWVIGIDRPWLVIGAGVLGIALILLNMWLTAAKPKQ